MAIPIELPQVGESVVEGTIGKWLKQPGDVVKKYDPLVEVVTDKVTMEVPAPFAGVLSSILAQEGETVPVGTAIAEVETSEDVTPSETRPVSASPSPAVGATVGTSGYLVKDFKQVGPTGGGAGDAGAPATADEQSPSIPKAIDGGQPAKPAGGEQELPDRRARYSPAVRRLAQEHNIDLGSVVGSGMGGRITRDDVMAFVKGDGAPSTLTSAPSRHPAPVAAGPDDEEISLTPIRRAIANNMQRSASEIPHAWGMTEADVTALVRLRESIKGDFVEREGVELTYLPFVLKAVVESLKKHPYVNSQWGGDKILLKKQLNLGIAVAAADGLVVPVVHGADGMSISALARSVRDLTSRARQNKLTLDDVQGGTFTVNNTGALGSILSRPIINYPQAGILTTEAIQKRPVVIDDAIAIRSMMNICFSFDHRVMDGAEASGFLQTVKTGLEAMGTNTPIH